MIKCNINIINKWYKRYCTTILYHCTGIMVQNPIYNRVCTYTTIPLLNIPK